MGHDRRFRYKSSLDLGECSMSHEMEGPFAFLSCLIAFLFGHTLNDPNDKILVQKYLELRGIIDCSRHDFSWDRVSIPTCEPVLVPTMPPDGSAADIGVEPSNHRVAYIHLRGHPIAKITILEQSKLFHCVSPCTFVGSVIALRGSYML